MATIELRHSDTEKVVGDVPMLLDTGADVTLLPRASFNKLEIPLDSSYVYEVMGFDGTRSTAIGVHLDLVFLGLTFRGRYLLVDQLDGILGRDILNHMNLAFNGPKLLWEQIR
jgi:hypothetical protein